VPIQGFAVDVAVVEEGMFFLAFSSLNSLLLVEQQQQKISVVVLSEK
jgi:hypothetical protein